MTRTLLLTAALGILVLPSCKDKEAEEPETVDLGSFTTDTGGLTGNISIDIPEGATSVLVHCGPYSDHLGTAWQIKDDGGSYYYTNEFHDDYSSKKMRVGNHENFLPVLMPVSPDHDISEGSWSMKTWIASGGSPVTVDCGAVVRTAEVADEASIDLHIVLVGVDGLSASNADSNGDLQDVIDTVDSIWSGKGLSVGAVTYEDFSGDAATYAVLDLDSGEMDALMKTASPEGSQVVTVFLVDEITDSGGSTIYGLSAGPPGAATVHGTSKSGMVVGAGTLSDDADFISLVMAHEGGHFLGLFHTSEKDGGSHDPLSDTDKCESSNDSDGNGRVSASECGGSADNVMFWSPAEGTSKLTSDQGWVLRRNPAVQ